MRKNYLPEARRPEPYDCPYCTRRIARGLTSRGSAEGMYMMHLKAKHPEEYAKRQEAKSNVGL